MMKVVKRGSRKKQQQPQQPPATARGAVAPASNPERAKPEQRPQQPPEQQQQQQRQAEAQRQRANSQEMQRRNVQRPREPTPEQVALTNKNYRLAKELSELRVRHREECKNATRLTMENMNLASRCREAITHVAMLKKELARHQQRAQEALALHREQTQRIATNLSAEVSRRSNTSHSLSFESESTPPRKEKTEMELVLAMEPPPPPPPPRPTEAPPEVVETVQQTLREKPQNNPAEEEVKPKGKEIFVEVDSSDEDDTVEDTGSRNRRSILDIVDSMSDLSGPTGIPSPSAATNQGPKVYSTPNRHRREDRWTPHIDATPGSVETESQSPGLFPQSASPKVVGSARSRNYNDVFPPDIIPQPTNHRVNANLASARQDPEDDDDSDNDEIVASGSYASRGSDSQTSLTHSGGMITMNSIDAFEASFDTTFPSDFAANEGSASQRARTPKSTEIYNPFAPSPSRGAAASQPSKAAFDSKSPRAVESVRYAGNGGANQYTTPPRKTRSPHAWESDLQYQTPPKELSPEASPQDEPSRPHKTASAEARARYEKALQPRTNAVADESVVTLQNANDTQDSSSSLVKGGPSRLLKRIQQRRKTKEQSNLPQNVNIAPEISASEVESEENQEPAVMQAATIQNVSAQTSLASPSNQRGPRAGSERPFDEMAEEPFDGAPRAAGVGRAGSKSARLQSLKHRRAVKQPVSYAEPALNTKIRKGHDFFPKNDVNSGAPQMVTPEHVAPTTAA